MRKNNIIWSIPTILNAMMLANLHFICWNVTNESSPTTIVTVRQDTTQKIFLVKLFKHREVLRVVKLVQNPLPEDRVNRIFTFSLKNKCFKSIKCIFNGDGGDDSTVID